MSVSTLPTPHDLTKHQLRSRLAALVRDHKPQAAIDAARRDYYAAALAEHITMTVAKAPPLTPAQLDRLATLLRGGAK